MHHPSSPHHKTKRTAARLILVMLLLLLTTILFAGSGCTAEPKPKADPTNAKQVSQGKKVYDRFCALCHGKNMEGQPNWRIRKADGKLPAPPHDETGHTWHHDDALLFGIIKEGLVPPYAPENYKNDMPAWGDTLKDEDIHAVLAYIKSRWPAETQRIQAERNQSSLK